MRKALLVLFWICLAGTIVRVPLLCFELWLLATTSTFDELTVWALLTEHLVFLAWLTDVITAVFGVEFGGWILDLPAILVTVVKLIFGTFVGIWALNAVRELDAAHPENEKATLTN